MVGLSVHEVAVLVGVSDQAVRKALAAGRLAGHRGADGSWVVAADDAHRWRMHRGQPVPEGRVPAAASPAAPARVPEPDLAPAMHALIQAHDDLLQVVRDLTDQVERARRASYGAAAPTG